MIIAMGSMGMVQVTVHQVINVVAVGHCLMAAGRPVNMRLFMPWAIVLWRAFIRVHRVHLNAMFLHMPITKMVHVPVVKIIRMAIVFYGSVTAIWAMLMAMSP
jgi:hypothetical protein